MPTLMFQSQFSPFVENGTKCQTIRPPRKRPIKTGDKLSLRRWQGAPYRSKQLVLRESVCMFTAPVHIMSYGGTVNTPDAIIIVNGAKLGLTTRALFARDDGFMDLSSMLAWFEKTHGLPFEGVLIRWE